MAAVVLAAGASRRMGPAHKLLVPLHGAPLVRHAVRSVLGRGAQPVVLVTGHRGDAVAAAVADLPVQRLHHPGWAAGMGSSLAAGVRALPDHLDGVLIMLGDMPLVPGAVVMRLITTWQARPQAIVVPLHQGRRGHPVLWPADLRSELEALDGEVGGRGLLARHRERIRGVPVRAPGVLADVDTPEDLSGLPATTAGGAPGLPAAAAGAYDGGEDDHGGPMSDPADRLDPQTRLEVEAAAFRAMVAHFREHPEVQNIDVMNVAGFCRNCLSRWYAEAAAERGVDLSKAESREIVYGMPYEAWKAKHQT